PEDFAKLKAGRGSCHPELYGPGRIVQHDALLAIVADLEIAARDGVLAAESGLGAIASWRQEEHSLGIGAAGDLAVGAVQANDARADRGRRSASGDARQPARNANARATKSDAAADVVARLDAHALARLRAAAADRQVVGTGRQNERRLRS